MKTKIFVSSVQKEFSAERKALKDYIQGDALLSRFFEVFLFEDSPASDRRAKTLFLEEVRRCGIYLALIGNQYGSEDSSGLSSTHREFHEATRLNKPRFIFVKGPDDRELDSQLESRLELLDDRVLAILSEKTLSKSELAKSLGQKQASGTLHLIIRKLLTKGWIARTIPGKPNSRLQEYKLTAKGRAWMSKAS